MDRWNIFIKLFKSWFKSEWTAEDYPLRIRDQGEGPGHPRFFVQVWNWPTATGAGETREEAVADLQAFLERYRAAKGRLPRPGTHVPLTFASADRIRTHHDLVEKFVCQVLDVPDGAPVLISDESTLDHFEGAVAGEPIEVRFQQVFGVDVEDMMTHPIVDIFDQIKAQGQESPS
jgi:hypothetical protein